MARTVRRLTLSKRKHLRKEEFVHREGSTVAKETWRFHSDNGCKNFAFEKYFCSPIQVSEGQFRMQVKAAFQEAANDAEFDYIDPGRKSFYEYP